MTRKYEPFAIPPRSASKCAMIWAIRFHLSRTALEAAFPSDMLSVLIVLATQARGTCLFFEKMFESRLYFVDHLKQMGAKIVQCDPHRVVVTGPSPLYGETVSSPDIRAGISLVIAALAAKGTSTILNAERIDRGYVAVDRELRALGANIERKD